MNDRTLMKLSETTGIGYSFLYEIFVNFPKEEGYIYNIAAQRIYKQSLFNKEMALSLKELIQQDGQLLKLISPVIYNNTLMQPGQTIAEGKVVEVNVNSMKVIEKMQEGSVALLNYLLVKDRMTVQVLRIAKSEEELRSCLDMTKADKKKSHAHRLR
jgi:hypothetical protein